MRSRPYCAGRGYLRGRRGALGGADVGNELSTLTYVWCTGPRLSTGHGRPNEAHPDSGNSPSARCHAVAVYSITLVQKIRQAICSAPVIRNLSAVDSGWLVFQTHCFSYPRRSAD